MAASPRIVRAADTSVPYVGLRPFEEHESDRFFGRDRDADLLYDKILSGRLTILYAQSGLGKSSLLRAMVVPRLQANHARVIYFDAWAQDEPLLLLKDALVCMASDLGIPDAGRGSPTLAELARILCSRDDNGLVLVLDQFEEFLVHHAQSMEPLRSELAALLRSAKLDVTVVLSLREEFLAALEPLRQQILNLFQSTYRLEPLNDDALRVAIARPPQLFGGECDPELTECLVNDLRGMGAPSGEGAGLQLVELPMLQLVCQELWSHAGQKRLTPGLYDRLGRAERIINDYVRGLMPKRWADQRFTAQLLLHLAPPSGLKVSYAAEDLADLTGLEAGGIARELQRLSDARILHARQFRKTVRYELQHDAFIPVLRAWRHQIVERQRRMKWTRGLLLTAIGVGAVTTALGGLHSNQLRLQAMDRERASEKIAKERAEKSRSEAEGAQKRAEAALAESDYWRKQLENWQTGGIIEDLKDAKYSQSDREQMAPGRFEVLTYYVLWKTQGEDRFEKLRRLLETYAELLPADYGTPPEAKPETETGPAWPLVVQYSPDGLDTAGFNAMWSSIRDWVVENWAIPLPIQPHLEANHELRRGELRIAGAGKKVAVTAPADGKYFVKWPAEPLNAGPARDFIQHFEKAWAEFKPSSEEYRLVPRWSRPVWKLAGQTPRPPGAVAAYVAVMELLKNPEAIFSPTAVNALLKQAARTYSQTVAEARISLGDKLGPALAERVRLDRRALVALPAILDELSMPAASGAASSLNNAVPPGQRLNGAWPAPGKGDADSSANRTSDTSDDEPRPYDDLGHRLGEFPPVRVNVAENLVPEWFPNKMLSQELSEKLEDLRADIYARYGVNVPGIKFRPPGDEGTMDRNTVRIHVFEANPKFAITRPIGGSDKLQTLLRELRSALVARRSMLVTADTTDDALKRVPPNTREWLQKKYSLTDLKRLFRYVVRSSGEDGGGTRYPTWMMNSLVFWALTDNPVDGDALGKRLSSGQKVRVSNAGAPPANEITKLIETGVNALLEDKPAVATPEFQNALKVDRGSAIDAFHAIWARRTPAVWLRELRNDSRNLDAVAFDRWSQLDLEEQSKAAEQTGDRTAAWAIALYRLAAHLVTDQKAAQRKLLAEAPDNRLLRPEEEGWLARAFLKQFSPLNQADAALLEPATRMLTSSVDERVDGPTALNTFNDMLTVAQTTPTPNWAWTVLDRLATARPGDAENSLTLELAWQLCVKERAEPLTRALALADAYENLVRSAAISQEKRGIANENIKYMRAKAFLGLRRLGETSRPSPEPLLRELDRPIRKELREDVNIQLTQFLDENGRHAEAVALGRKAAAEWPDNASFPLLALSGSLQYEDNAGARSLAESVAKTVNGAGPARTDKQWLFTASIGGLMAQTSDWRPIANRFLATDHEYRDYVRMIALALDSSSRASEWKQVLDQRWKEIDPSGWRDRIRNGDMTAWREMLIGRFVGAKGSQDLLKTLDDPAAWAKSEFADLSEPRNGQRCEAWFYEAMRAKAEGQKDHELEALRRSIATESSSYLEYAMARFLLAKGG
jgi:hypothetical protein